ncbi:MAG: 5'/3'-nucleotidase SurE [Prevotellaceae bacterium]|jgi:5'-nucleotidase|nr:5'/3'-nucleotidase SurE [Prevotellaceae bacterium]
MKKKPFILVTNDDGVQAKGIAMLTEIARELGDVLVVAPDAPRSGQSSAMTVNLPVMYHELERSDAFTQLACTGLPVDCVKLAFSQQIPHLNRRPDMVLSGINHGSNAAINVVYSGTMGAAIEGALYHVPSIGFSLCNHEPDADFSAVKAPFRAIVEQIWREGLPQGVCLNVNAPTGAIAGIRTVRQSRGCWRNEFMTSAMPHGNGVCFWLTGEFVNEEAAAQDTDEAALNQGFISVQPVHADMTHYPTLQNLVFKM